MVIRYMTRRDLLAASPALAMAAKKPPFELCMHQTTSASAGFRQTLEGYAKAGFHMVEVIPPKVAEYVKAEGIAGAKRLLGDLGMKAVSSSGVRGLAEPSPTRPKILEELKTTCELIAGLGVDRIVCPCGTTATYTEDDYKRGVENLREAGDIAKQFGLTVTRSNVDSWSAAWMSDWASSSASRPTASSLYSTITW